MAHPEIAAYWKEVARLNKQAAAENELTQPIEPRVDKSICVCWPTLGEPMCGKPAAATLRSTGCDATRRACESCAKERTELYRQVYAEWDHDA